MPASAFPFLLCTREKSIVCDLLALFADLEL